MKKIVGVRFKKPGKIYYFDPQDLKMNVGDKVIVETTAGDEFGEVAVNNRELPEDKIVNPLKKVIRVATLQDIKNMEYYKKKEAEAIKICEEKIKQHNLDMKLTDAEYKFDGSKLLFYFTADGRVDFRELVKDLASIFKTRIELRQIGVRDEVKRIGGNGVCGRELCCCSFLGNFENVSIKMAKEQNLSLNPTKISGNCGRLMCCLKYEHCVYEDKLKKLPKVGAIVKTAEGKGVVDSVEVLREILRVKFKEGEESYYKKFNASEVTIIKNGTTGASKVDPEEAEHMKELKELEKLERIDRKNATPDEI